MRPKLMIWDFNGTILDDAELCFAIENEMLLERGMKPITRDWYFDHFSFPIRDYYLQMGYTFETESYERVSEIFMERYNARYTGCPLREGVTEALAAFREAGMLQTLLSVTQQDDLERQAKKLGVAPYFSEMLGQTDIMGHSKVARAKEYMRRMRLDPEEALFIGDTDHDAEAAEAVGCPCVLLLGGHQSERVLSRCGVPIYASAKALQNALLKE